MKKINECDTPEIEVKPEEGEIEVKVGDVEVEIKTEPEEETCEEPCVCPECGKEPCECEGEVIAVEPAIVPEEIEPLFTTVEESMAKLKKVCDLAEGYDDDLVATFGADDDKPNYIHDEPIDDEFELIRNALREYSESDEAFKDGFVTVDELKDCFSLYQFDIDDIIECAKEEGYEVEDDRILDPCA